MSIEPEYILKVEKVLQENHPTEKVSVYTQPGDGSIVFVYAMIGRNGIIISIDPVDISEKGWSEEYTIEQIVNQIEDQIH